MISVCTTIKNRSKLKVGDYELQLFPNCVKSLVQAVSGQFECELVVTDWESDDWPLENWLIEAADPIPVRIVSANGAFSRGKGRNLAANAALGSIVCFVDADMLLSRHFFQEGFASLERGRACFPIPYSFLDPQHRSGYWRARGFGNCVLQKDVFQAAGGWPEYITWGDEDTHFFHRVSSLQGADRPITKEFFHQWHPNDIDWKNRYDESTDEQQKADETLRQVEREMIRNLEIEHARSLRNQLCEVIPNDVVFILISKIDYSEESWGKRRALPFLERNGVYWGKPSDDTVAVREIERMRNSNAKYLAFTHDEFWWLDHYREFGNYISSHFSRVIQNDRIVVYRLAR